MKSRTECEIGDLARDTVTGFEGVVVARTDWLNGCIRFVLQPRELKDGKPIDGISFDCEQVELVKRSVVTPKAPEKATGGPMPDVKRK